MKMMAGLRTFLNLRTFIFRPSLTASASAFTTKHDLFSYQSQPLNCNSVRATKNFAHTRKKSVPLASNLYTIFLILTMAGGILGAGWKSKERVFKPFKLDAASALAESNKRKSKKNEDSDPEQDVDEGKLDSKGKKKERPGFRDRKVC